jgi:hypothetical protein
MTARLSIVISHMSRSSGGIGTISVGVRREPHPCNSSPLWTTAGDSRAPPDRGPSGVGTAGEGVAKERDDRVSMAGWG